jgi:hypothetical protein
MPNKKQNIGIVQNIPIKKSKSKFIFYKLFDYLNNYVQTLNNSKIFAGLMIITLNIASKFVNIKLGKTLEAYLKYSFSRQILVFAIAWMGTRDIYIALVVTICFTICTEYLFHEDSSFFILSPEFRDYHISLLENHENMSENIMEEKINAAIEILEKVKKQNKQNSGNKISEETDEINKQVNDDRDEDNDFKKNKYRDHMIPKNSRDLVSENADFQAYSFR